MENQIYNPENIQQGPNLRNSGQRYNNIQENDDNDIVVTKDQSINESKQNFEQKLTYENTKTHIKESDLGESQMETSA